MPAECRRCENCTPDADCPLIRKMEQEKKEPRARDARFIAWYGNTARQIQGGE